MTIRLKDHENVLLVDFMQQGTIIAGAHCMIQEQLSAAIK
jgi:hypothetical protein